MSTAFYTITLENNKSEKEAEEFLLSANGLLFKPDSLQRRQILQAISIDSKYSRAFDLVMMPGISNGGINFDPASNFTLIELKTTKKKLSNLPDGFFFGATESEFKLAELLGNRYKFCFVSLHPESKGYVLMTLEELVKRIKTKRVQYQINL